MWSKAWNISPAIAGNCDRTMILFSCLAVLLLITQALALNCIGRFNLFFILFTYSHRERIYSKRKVVRQVKGLIKNLAIFSFYFPARNFCRRHLKFSCCKLLSKKQKEQRQKQLGADKLVRSLKIWCLFLFFLCLFPSCTFLILCHLLLLFTYIFAKFD